MDTSVLILAGGLATRLRPLTEKFPKALVPILGKPFIHYQLQLLQSEGFHNIVLCIGYEGEQIREELGDGSNLGVSIQYSMDGKVLLGTGGAVMKALPLLSDPFLVLYGDSYLQVSYAAVLEKMQVYPEMQALMTVYQNGGNFDTSNVHFENGKLLLYDKMNPRKEMNHIDWGLGILRKSCFADTTEAKFDLAEVYMQLSQQKKLLGYEVFQRFYEIGSHKGIADLEDFLKSEEIA
ncbi:MAG: sugar phosphate nucleotidyltransferase [Spirochaetota bacterium]